MAHSTEGEEVKSGDAKLDENDTEAQAKSGEGSMEPESLAVSNLSYAVNIGKTKSCWKPRRATWGSLLGPALAKIAGKKLQSSLARAEEEEEKPVTELTLLNEVTARFKCGRMTALMGQSGAGKTTLLVSRISSLLVFELAIFARFLTFQHLIPLIRTLLPDIRQAE